jgi:hypothetical protein
MFEGPRPPEELAPPSVAAGGSSGRADQPRRKYSRSVMAGTCGHVMSRSHVMRLATRALWTPRTAEQQPRITCNTRRFCVVGPPGLEPGTYGSKDSAPAATLASEADVSRDFGAYIRHQLLSCTPFRVTFDVTPPDDDASTTTPVGQIRTRRCRRRRGTSHTEPSQPVPARRQAMKPVVGRCDDGPVSRNDEDEPCAFYEGRPTHTRRLMRRRSRRSCTNPSTGCG